MDTDVKLIENNKSKNTKKHGWWRSMYYYMGWHYDSSNDNPDERSVYLKNQVNRQVRLSKLKLNKTELKDNTPTDLKPIKVKENEYKLQNIVDIPPVEEKINIDNVELSLKQRNQKLEYTTKLDILRSL